jgi:Spy/CpxP family protein refolding chaperone
MLEVKMKFRIANIFAALLVLICSSSLQAQIPDPTGAPDPIEQLRLTPEQRQRIRLIVEENKDERQMTNRRLREANIALDQALDSEPTDESLIEQRVIELAAAQAAQLRIRVKTELRIRRELRPEQLATLRRLRLQVRDVMGAQRPGTQRSGDQRPGARPAQRQGLRPRP